jgi:GNAT superfamily N-acetyltransferase
VSVEGLVAIELRQATLSDASAIRDLTRRAYAKWVPLIGREPVPMTADYDVAVRQHRFDLLVSHDSLAALIETVEENEQILIENLAVAPSFQRQGLGRFLLRHAEHLARQLGKPRIRLYTNQRFAENILFYERNGYRVDREEDFGTGIAVHMSRAVGVKVFPTPRARS